MVSKANVAVCMRNIRPAVGRYPMDLCAAFLTQLQSLGRDCPISLTQTACGEPLETGSSTPRSHGFPKIATPIAQGR